MSKYLIAYFTWSGNSKKIAKAISEKIEADIFEIKTVKNYPETYLACVAYAGAERLKKERPKLEKYLESIEEYETIILVFPNWWNGLPTAVFHFLESYDFSGKRILPVCTHGGGGIGKSEQHIRETCPSAEILKGEAIHKKELGSLLAEQIYEKIKETL